MKLIGDSIQYIENHLLDDISVEDIAKHIGISSFYYQKGFSMLCGFTVSEYVRSRRLALAGNDLATSDAKVIDIALKYGYDSPDSFAKAFTRFHGVTPMAVALAWVLRYPAKMQAVIGTTKPSRVREAARACDFELTRKEWYEIYCSAGNVLP